MQIRVLLVDDHTLVGEGIAAILDNLENVEVTCVCGSAEEALDWLERLPIDAVVTDVAMPATNGIELARAIRRRWPAIKVLALSMHAERPFVRAMVRAGVSAYLLKDGFRGEIGEAIRKVFAGGTYASQRISGYFTLSESAAASGCELTAREYQVLQLIAQGESTKGIAERLNISVKTVETHRGHISSKLDLHNVADLTRYAIREGLIAP